MTMKKYEVFVHRDVTGVMPDFLGVTNIAGQRCFEDFVAIGPFSVEIDVPEVDTRQQAIESLECQIQQERADSQSRINLLLERISKLQAIGHEVEA